MKQQIFRIKIYRENILEIFKVKMIKYLETELLKTTTTGIEASIKGWTSNDLRLLINSTFAAQCKTIDERTKLLKELFHKELNEPWMTTFSCNFSHMDKVEEINPTLAQHLKESEVCYSKILESFYSWLSQHNWFEKASQVRKQKAVTELEVYIEIFKAYFNYVEEMYNQVEHNVRAEWNNTLTPLDKDVTLNKFNLIVSLGKADWFKKHNEIVSASYITEEHPKMFASDGQRMGWCFDVGHNDVLSMCPYDFNSGLTEHKELCSLELYQAALAGAEFTEQLCVFRTEYPDVLRWYKPQDLIERTKDRECNEILLRATNNSPNPTAVFVITESSLDKALLVDEHCKRVSTIANIYGLPLVMYSELSNLISIVTKPEVIA